MIVAAFQALVRLVVLVVAVASVTQGRVRESNSGFVARVARWNFKFPKDNHHDTFIPLSIRFSSPQILR